MTTDVAGQYISVRKRTNSEDFHLSGSAALS